MQSAWALKTINGTQNTEISPTYTNMGYTQDSGIRTGSRGGILEAKHEGEPMTKHTQAHPQPSGHIRQPSHTSSQKPKQQRGRGAEARAASPSQQTAVLKAL